MTPEDTREPGGESASLDDQLCFALYAASRAVTQRYRPLLEELGLTYPQYLVMMVLWEHGTVPIKDIGTTLQLDYGTLTPLIKRLGAAQLVRRERCADDERTVHVSLTEQGTELRRRALAVPGAMSHAMALPSQDLDEAKRILRQLTSNVSHRAAAGTPGAIECPGSTGKPCTPGTPGTVDGC
ncbi:winged helix-turn-helix transcriptional regulator [Streptomyces clavuligerus]|nr:MarR family winged helix-turn-helix transcriptional regulator [Streptomyces clavuligerus]AXU16172.1 MarR family transcriptional regulator [Streptomyces clavuligerus]MBY6306322.1 winged helix-turn-helix transcriptional regulator [Streptomyces clavuligerus]QCS08951.1 MarR family transcriptional regulator [Streptomyces clavuligerus]QPJ96517.1 MarR family transcriptional regulator [Streptomyces clavuligerus]QPL66815.1 winged helix-turn-helix transcriptional regulator [Streptomyces clavuligerus]